jgi:hypothetical protein
MNRLRRLLTAPNWKYAAGEIALIVAGVLIALAVDSWADDRQERQRERAYLVQLLADVRENERRIQQAVREDSTQFYVGLSRVLRAARRPGPLQLDSVGVFTGFSMFRPLTGTYTALVQSGSVNLLRNDRLRFEVIRYAGEMESVASSFRTAEDVTVRTVAAWNHAEWRGRRLPPGAGARWREDLDWEALLHDPEVLSALDMQRDAIRMHMYLLRSLQEPTATLRQMLEKELRVRPGAAASK